MCDTMCVLPENGDVLFAKNNDRSPNEPHIVIRSPARRGAQNQSLKLTYIEIPEVNQTLETVLLKPSWIWGAEMGVNSAGVAIGNEAVFTRRNRAELKQKALIGMDLLRLALERAESAEKAVEVITSLLERYGQGGNCGYDHEFYYDNSFLTADTKEAYILETSGRRWAARRVESRGAISNRLSIRSEHTLRGEVDEGFDFAKKLTEPVFTYFSGSKQRLNCTFSSISKNNIGVAGMMAALRAHNERDEHRVFARGSVRSVCMHAGGLIGDQTTGSLVAVLRKDAPSTLWITGSSTPCISVFKPYFFGINSGAPVFEDENEAKNYWLTREKLHRAVLSGLVDVDALRKKRDELEARWIEQEKVLFETQPDTDKLLELARSAAKAENELVHSFLPKTDIKMPGRNRFARYWQKKNAKLF